MAANNDKIDPIHALHFIWKNNVYILRMNRAGIYNSDYKLWRKRYIKKAADIKDIISNALY